MEDSSKKTVVVKPARKKDVISKWVNPNLFSIATKIVADDEKFIPKYQTKDAACADLVANLAEPLQIFPQGVAIIDCGFSLELKSGYKACIVARSGTAKKGMLVGNAPGQIDPDYRGRVGVVAVNITSQVLTIYPDDRIAQIYVEPIYKFDWIRATKEDLSETDRGQGGFGSTGR